MARSRPTSDLLLVTDLHSYTPTGVTMGLGMAVFTARTPEAMTIRGSTSAATPGQHVGAPNSREAAATARYIPDVHPSTRRYWWSVYPLGSTGSGSRPHRIRTTPRTVEKRRETNRGGHPRCVGPSAEVARRSAQTTRHSETFTRLSRCDTDPPTPAPSSLLTSSWFRPELPDRLVDASRDRFDARRFPRLVTVAISR